MEMHTFIIIDLLFQDEQTSYVTLLRKHATLLLEIK